MLDKAKGLVPHLGGAFLVLFGEGQAVLLFEDFVFFLDFSYLGLAAGDDALDLRLDAFEGVLGDLLFFLFLPLLPALLLLLGP